MTWAEQHARTDILHTVLTRAAYDPAAADLFHDLPDCDRLFGGPAGVLSALHYQWDNHLRARQDLALVSGQTAAETYLQLAAEQPVLRSVLDSWTCGADPVRPGAYRGVALIERPHRSARAEPAARSRPRCPLRRAASRPGRAERSEPTVPDHDDSDLRVA